MLLCIPVKCRATSVRLIQHWSWLAARCWEFWVVWGVILHALLCFGALGGYCLLCLQYQSNWLWLPVIDQDFQNDAAIPEISCSGWPHLEDWVWKISEPQSSLNWESLRESAQDGLIYLPKGDSISSTASELHLRNVGSKREQFWFRGFHLGYLYPQVSETTLKAKLRWLIHQDLYRYRVYKPSPGFL